MLFLNLIMLGGTLAAAVPATLHLWAKSKPRTVRWAAMHLLRGAEASQSRRMRIEQLILLLLRILIPVAMALLMARATLTGEQMLAGDKPVSLAVLLDDSASMQAAGRGQAANEAVAAVLQALPRGSDAVVLPLSGLGEDPASATDLAGLAKRVRAGAPGDAPAAVPLRLATTTPLVAGMARADRLVLLVSDLQTGSWSDAESDARRRLGKALADLPSGPRLALLPVPSGQPSNLVVGSISVDRELIGPGQPLRLRASLAAFGPQGFPSIRLRLLLDGSEVATASAELPAGGSTEALFPCTITKAGSHVLAVEASAPGDSIAADSTARLSVAVTEQVPVLLVDGAPVLFSLVDSRRRHATAHMMSHASGAAREDLPCQHSAAPPCSPCWGSRRCGTPRPSRMKAAAAARERSGQAVARETTAAAGRVRGTARSWRSAALRRPRALHRHGLAHRQFRLDYDPTAAWADLPA